MNQQQPNQHPQQSGWGAPQTPPGCGYAAPAPPPPKKRGAGKIAGIGCAGIFGLLVLIGVIGAVVGDDSGGGNGKATTAQGSAPAGTGQNAAQEKSDTFSDSKPAEEAQVPVKVAAKKAAFVKSILANGSDYTSVLVTVTNDGDEQIDVNPLFFTITGTNGTKHTAELAVDENQIDTVKLAPGENISGTVTGTGSFTPKYVTFTEGFLGDSIRADVS